MTTSVQKPTLDFDHHSTSMSENRPAVLDQVREHPIFYSEHHGGFWVVASYELAKAVLPDGVHFSNTKHDDGSGGVTIPTAIGPRILPAEADGDYHKKLKRIVSARLGKRHVNQIVPQIEKIVTEAFDRIIEQGDFDVVEDIGEMIPAGVIVSYLGFDDEVRVPLIRAVQGAVSAIPMVGGMPEDGPTPEMQEAAKTFEFVLGEIKKLIAIRRAEPKDDLISYWVQPEHELSDDEIMWMTFTLVLGGAENPAALIENAILRLYQDSELRERLTQDPELIERAVEEFLREINPGNSLARTCIKDIEIGGQLIKEGERVLIWLPGANHDASVFDRPDELDIDREKCPHIAFGVGAHNCPGAFITRLEFGLVIKQLLERMPNYTIDIDNCKRFEDASLAYCFRKMPANTGIKSANGVVVS